MRPDHRRRLEAIEAELPSPSEHGELAELPDFLTRNELDRLATALDRYRLPNGSFDVASIRTEPGTDLVDLLARAWERRAAGWSHEMVTKLSDEEQLQRRYCPKIAPSRHAKEIAPARNLCATQNGVPLSYAAEVDVTAVAVRRTVTQQILRNRNLEVPV